MLCDALERDESTVTESALLRARVFLRMQRADDARILLAPLLPHTTGDQAVEVRALLGTAYARSGDVERGLSLLEEANVVATSVELRSEIALGIALAHYAKRDFSRAEDSLAAVDASSILVHARALECRGWIAKCRGAFPAAVSFFEAALTELDRSPQRDRFLEANLMMVLGNLAVELLDLRRWEDVARRAASIAWDGLGMSYYRFWHLMNESMMAEMGGRPREALQAARSAALGSPSNAFRTFAHCRRAAVLLAYEELLGYADLAATIREEFDAIDLSALRAYEEINLAAVVVATLAQIGDAGGAAATFARLGAMSPAQRALLTDEPLKRGYVTYVEGLLADAGHDAFTAQHRYREAFRMFEAIGLPRRALLAALRLIEVNGDPAALAYIDKVAIHLPASSWVRIRAATAQRRRTDPLFGGLSRAEREVLALLYEGHSTAEIAAQRGRSTQTIRNTVSALFKEFGVDSRAALISECRRRAIFSDARRAPTTPA